MPRREYDKPLGPPQGLGKRGWTNPEGQYFSNVYTREFAHASVWVNVQTRNGIIHWRAPADTTAGGAHPHPAAKSDDAAAASVQPPPACGTALYASTLCYLHPQGLRKLPASEAGCCAACANASWCSSWVWSNADLISPCHLSSFDFSKKVLDSPGDSCGTVRKPQPPPPPPPPEPAPKPPPNNGVYTIDTTPSGLRQVFEGVQVELQADSIGETPAHHTLPRDRH